FSWSDTGPTSGGDGSARTKACATRISMRCRMLRCTMKKPVFQGRSALADDSADIAGITRARGGGEYCAVLMIPISKQRTSGRELMLHCDNRVFMLRCSAAARGGNR